MKAAFILFVGVSLAEAYWINPSDCDFHQHFYGSGPAKVPSTSSIAWHLPLTTPSHGHPCRRQGVLRVTPPAGKTKTRVSFWLFRPDDYTFHIADSSTCNGNGGDAGTSAGWAAEIHNRNSDLLIFENVQDQVGPPAAHTVIPKYFESFSWRHVNNFNISIAAASPIVGDPDTPTDVNINSTPEVSGTTIRMISNEMFRYDTFYVGANRVVYPRFTSRDGAGACEVCIKFY